MLLKRLNENSFPSLGSPIPVLNVNVKHRKSVTFEDLNPLKTIFMKKVW